MTLIGSIIFGHAPARPNARLLSDPNRAPEQQDDDPRHTSFIHWENRQLYFGIALIAVALLLNQWVLATAFSADGNLERQTIARIWSFELVVGTVGTLLICRRLSASWALPAIAAGGYVCLRFLLIWLRRFDQDEFEHLHAAWCIAHGQTIYKDFFEHHGPLFYLLLWPITAAVHDAVVALWTARSLMAVFWGGMLLLQWHLAPRDWSKWQRFASVALLGLFTTFGVSSIEIRPDVPAAFLFSAILILGRSYPTKWKSFSLGLMLSCAALLSLKLVFCGVGFLAGYVLSHAKQTGFRRFIADLHVGRFLTGMLVPPALVLAFFCMKNAAGDLWENYGLFNLTFHQNGSHWKHLLRSVQQNPTLWALGAAGAYLGRRNRMLLFAFLTTLLAAVVSPSPYDQHYLFLAAPLGYFAALTCTAIYSRLARLGDRRLWGLAALCSGALLILAFAEQAATIEPTNEAQIAEIRCVMEATQPTDRIFDFWTGFAFYRPHAYYYWFLPEDVSDSIGRERLKKDIPKIWADPASRALIWDERSFARGYSELRTPALTVFHPAHCGSLYVRRGVSPQPTSVH